MAASVVEGCCGGPRTMPSSMNETRCWLLVSVKDSEGTEMRRIRGINSRTLVLFRRGARCFEEHCSSGGGSLAGWVLDRWVDGCRFICPSTRETRAEALVALCRVRCAGLRLGRSSSSRCAAFFYSG